MSKKTKIRLRYKGQSVNDHNMDVTDLGSSLMALGELCRLANHKFNKDDANVHVFVRADQEHQCFELVLEVFQSLKANALGLIGEPVVQDIKEILEWIGLIGGGGYGLFRFLAWIKGRNVENVEIKKENGKDVAVVTIKGGDRITVNSNVYQLFQDKNIVHVAGKTISPLEKNGYSSIEFEESPNKIQKIIKEDVEYIKASVKAIDLIPIEEPQQFNAWLRVYAPVYNESANKWRFRFGDKSVEYFDISNTSIAKDAVERGGSLMDDLYHVKAELCQSINRSGNIKNEYSIIEVLEFKQASNIIQTELKMDDNNDKPTKEDNNEIQ